MRAMLRNRVAKEPVVMVTASPPSSEEPGTLSPSSSSVAVTKREVSFQPSRPSGSSSSSSSESSSESEEEEKKEEEEEEEEEEEDEDESDSDDDGGVAFRPRLLSAYLHRSLSVIPEAPPLPPAGWSAGRLPPSPPPQPAAPQRGKAKNHSVWLSVTAPKQTAKPDWTCNICYGEFRGSVGRAKCAQGHEFCKTCMGNYLRHCALENKKFKCPMHYACGLELPTPLVQKYLPPSTFTSYVVNNAMEQVRPGDWVFRCSKIDCPGVLNIQGGVAPFSANCSCCGSYKSLSERERKIFEEVYGQQELSLEDKIDTIFLRICTKPCPHCHKIIEKDDGCPHMTCICGNSFCWNCGKKYNYTLPFLLGRHNSKYGYKGCPELLFPNNRKACKVTRGLLLTGKTAALVTLGPPVLAAGLVVAGIPYGIFLGARKGYQTLRNRAQH